MVDVSIKEIVDFLHEQLRKHGINISRIIVFGSCSRNENSEGSDCDIAIISDEFTGKDIFERVNMVRIPEIETIRKFMIPLDLVLLSCEEFEHEDPLIVSCVKQGQTFFTAV